MRQLEQGAPGKESGILPLPDVGKAVESGHASGAGGWSPRAESKQLLLGVPERWIHIRNLFSNSERLLEGG